MVNFMNYGKKFLKVGEFEDLFTHNVVQIESDGLIDPYLPEPREGSSLPKHLEHGETITKTNPVDNGAALLSWDNRNLFWWIDELRLVHNDDSQIYVCQIPKSEGPPCHSLPVNAESS